MESCDAELASCAPAGPGLLGLIPSSRAAWLSPRTRRCTLKEAVPILGLLLPSLAVRLRDDAWPLWGCRG